MTVRTICSEDEDTFLQRDQTAVALDLETMDDFRNDIDDAPIIGYSLTLFDLEALEDAMPTLVRLIDDLQEERDLLEQLFADLRALGEVTLVGHNLAFPEDFEHLDAEGYDLPKLEARAEVRGLDGSFLHGFETYDTMDVAGGLYRHEEHSKSHTWLKLDELKDWMGIEPPAKFIGLGPDVRRLWRRDGFDRIMLYNAADTMVEARLATIFYHQLEVCTATDGLIGAELCEHVEELTPLKDLPAWSRLKGLTSFAGSDV